MGRALTTAAAWSPRLLPAVLFLAVFSEAAAVAVREKAISPFDEAAHFDYVVRLQHGDFPVPAGVTYTEEALQAWACRPTDKAASVAYLCGEVGSSTGRVPFEGVNYEAPFGPVYYALAALGSSVLRVVPISNFTAVRLVSAALYALGVALLLLVSQRLAVSSAAAAGAILAAASTGLALGMGSTISPDAMAFLETALVIATALLPRGWRTAVIGTGLASTVAGLTKPNFILIAILGAALLLLRWYSIERGKATRPSAPDLLPVGFAVGLPVGLAAISSAAWAGLSYALNSTGAPADGGVHLVLRRDLGPVERFVDQLGALARPDGGTWPGTPFTVLDYPLFRAAGAIVVVIIAAACLYSWLRRANTDVRSLIVLRAVSLALPVSAAVLVVVVGVTYQGGHWTASRYALPFLAAASVGLGSLVPRRLAPVAMLVGVGAWASAWAAILALP